MWGRGIVVWYFKGVMIEPKANFYIEDNWIKDFYFPRERKKKRDPKRTPNK